MSEKTESKSIEQLLAEADELIKKISSGAIEGMNDEHRLQVDKHARHLEKVKNEIQGKMKKNGQSEMGSGADGMHEAFLDISKAMRNLTKYLA
ncbi:MAG: hypothetical protein JEZ11_23630 [Desulfobacterales bacterium]|nr:hypothetical protein [Desulfobacterales bacterium]